MKITPRRVIQLVILVGFTLVIGGHAAHEYIMAGNEPGAWPRVRHPAWIDYCLFIGWFTLLAGTFVAAVGKLGIIKACALYVLIGVLASIFFPTVC